jgi:hypothetical protein
LNIFLPAIFLLPESLAEKWRAEKNRTRRIVANNRRVFDLGL